MTIADIRQLAETHKLNINLMGLLSPVDEQQNIEAEQNPGGIPQDPNFARLIGSLKKNKKYVSDTQNIFRTLKNNDHLENNLIKFHSKLNKFQRKYYNGAEGADWTSYMLKTMLQVTKEKNPKTYSRLTTFFNEKKEELEDVIGNQYGDNVQPLSHEYQEALQKIELLREFLPE